MNIPTPATVKAIQDRQIEADLQKLESLATSANTAPGQPSPNSKKTESEGVRLTVVPGHDVIPYEDEVAGGLLFKCRCGFLPTSPDDQARHQNAVKTKSIRKPFVPSERLTQRPMSGDKSLIELRNQLERDRRTSKRAHPSNHKPKPAQNIKKESVR